MMIRHDSRAALSGALALASASAAPAAASDPNYCPATAYVAADTVFGLAAGQLRRGAEHDSLAALVNPSSVVLVHGPEGRAEVIHASDDTIGDPENRATLSIGNVSGGRANEIVLSGNNRVTVLSPSRRGWHAQVVYDVGELVSNLWGARVGDYDPIRPGNEILVIHETLFDFSIADLIYRERGAWRTFTLYAGEVGMDSAAGDFDPTIPGPETVIVTEMGVSHRIHAPEQIGGIRGEEPWPRSTFWDAAAEEPDVQPDNSGWVVKITDLDPAHPGDEIVWGTRYSNRVLTFSVDAKGGYSHHVVLEGSLASDENEPARNMWDVAVADLLPETAGQEIVAVDGSGNVYLAWNDAGVWQQRAIWQDAAPLYAVAAGDLDPDARGLEIAVGGESKAVTLLTRCRKPK